MNTKRVVKVGSVIYCRYIVRNGKRIYPKKAKVFRFFVKK